MFLPVILALAIVGAAPPPSIMNPADRDLMIRTVVGEANGEPFQGQKGVAGVVLNRFNSGKYGSTMSDVLFAPKQFEPWNTRRAELLSYSETDPAYQRAARAVDAVLAGDNPIGSRTHFANVGTVAARGNTRGMSWINGMPDSLKIGNHTFGTADEGSSSGKRRRGAVPEIDTSDDEDPPVAMTSRGGGGRGKGAGGGAGDSFSLAAIMRSLSEQPVDEEHAQIKGLMGDTVNAVAGDLGMGEG